MKNMTKNVITYHNSIVWCCIGWYCYSSLLARLEWNKYWTLADQSFLTSVRAFCCGFSQLKSLVLSARCMKKFPNWFVMPCLLRMLVHRGSRQSPDLASLLNDQHSDPGTCTVHHSRWSLLPGYSARLLIDGDRAPLGFHVSKNPSASTGGTSL